MLRIAAFNVHEVNIFAIIKIYELINRSYPNNITVHKVNCIKLNIMKVFEVDNEAGLHLAPTGPRFKC